LLCCTGIERLGNSGSLSLGFLTTASVKHVATVKILLSPYSPPTVQRKLFTPSHPSNTQSSTSDIPCLLSCHQPISIVPLPSNSHSSNHPTSLPPKQNTTLTPSAHTRHNLCAQTHSPKMLRSYRTVKFQPSRSALQVGYCRSPGSRRTWWVWSVGLLMLLWVVWVSVSKYCPRL
jgi:hypothetical protein